MVNLSIQLIAPEQRPPALENGMRNGQYAVVGDGVIGSQARHEIVDERVPSFPEVAVGNDAHGLAELGLDGGRAGDHERDELALDGENFVGGELVVAVFIGPIALDEVLEEEGGGETGGVGCCLGCGDVKELQGEARFLLLGA